MGHLDEALDLLLIFFQQGTHYFGVHDMGSIEVGEQKPDEEQESDCVPVRNQFEQESNISLKSSERAEHHPVGQPVLVVIAFWCLDGTDRLERWVEDCECRDKDQRTVHVYSEESCDHSEEKDWCAWVDVHLLCKVVQKVDLSPDRVKDARVLCKLFLDLFHFYEL